jgi:formate dehydrogenase major subunit
VNGDAPAASFELTLDGRKVVASAGMTLWDVAKQSGDVIPHLCFKDAPGYRADGNCRACMVEIEGERVLAASCLRKAAPGMVVRSTTSDRARVAREGVMELLLADQPERGQSPDRSSHFWQTVEQLGLDATASRRALPQRAPDPARRDASHIAMRVNLEACIDCGLCVRACREVQVNDVIGLAGRGASTRVVFDFGDPMGQSTCVACGECVQACPTGALMPASLVDVRGHGDSAATDRKVDSVCP